jgi:hypothetical protein
MEAGGPMKIALGAATALITVGAVLGMGQAYAEVGDIGASGSPITEDEVKLAACLYVSPLMKMTPAQAEEALEDGAAHLRPSHAHALVRSAIASGCQDGAP